MNNDTHGAIIVGDGFHAFVDGIPDKCEHDWSGPAYETISSHGEADHYQLAPENETAETFYPRQDALKKEGKWISGGGATCIKCGKYYLPEFY